MTKNSLYADISGIHIILPTLHEYVIEWWQIAKDGIHFWHGHLKLKRWFTPGISRMFMESYLEYSEMFLY